MNIFTNSAPLFVAVNAAFVAVVAAYFHVVPEKAMRFAKTQLEYVVGMNTGRSFMVGYGPNWPKQPRHVGS